MRKRFAFALLLVCAGCLPPGEPPVGRITDNTGKLPLTPEEKRERMITELTAALLRFAPGAAMQFRADSASVAEMETVVRECAKITGITHDRNSRWQLYSRYTGNEWIVDIIDGGKPVHTIRIER